MGAEFWQMLFIKCFFCIHWYECILWWIILMDFWMLNQICMPGISLIWLLFMVFYQCGRPGFDPCVGKIPWRRERLPTPVFWPGEVHGLYSPWGCKESDMTEWLTLSTNLSSETSVVRSSNNLGPTGLKPRSERVLGSSRQRTLLSCLF